MKNKNITPKSILLTRLENAISKSDSKDMEIVLPIAEEYKVSSKIIKKVSQKIAGFHFAAKRFDQAIIFYNKARSIDPSKRKVFELFCNSVVEFFKNNIDEFSRKDLEEYKQAIIPVIDFHKLKFPAHLKSIEEMEDLLRRIDYRRKNTAKEKEETKVSYRIVQINNAITGDMTMQEVHHELARSLSKIIRRKTDADNRKKKKVNKKGDNKEKKS